MGSLNPAGGAAAGGGLVAKSCPSLAIPWTVACRAPLLRFSKLCGGVLREAG